MKEQFLTLALLVSTIVLGEIVLWKTFRRRVDPVIYPTEHDASQVGFFRLGRMRVIAVMHTVALTGWIVFSFVWLW